MYLLMLLGEKPQKLAASLIVLNSLSNTLFLSYIHVTAPRLLSFNLSIVSLVTFALSLPVNVFW